MRARGCQEHRRQGDLEATSAAGLPAWTAAFQKSVAISTKWGVKQAVESRLLGAF